jgi:hypothetical protein
LKPGDLLENVIKGDNKRDNKSEPK